MNFSSSLPSRSNTNPPISGLFAFRIDGDIVATGCDKSRTSGFRIFPQQISTTGGELYVEGVCTTNVTSATCEYRKDGTLLLSNAAQIIGETTIGCTFPPSHWSKTVQLFIVVTDSSGSARKTIGYFFVVEPSMMEAQLDVSIVQGAWKFTTISTLVAAANAGCSLQLQSVAVVEGTSGFVEGDYPSIALNEIQTFSTGPVGALTRIQYVNAGSMTIPSTANLFAVVRARLVCPGNPTITVAEIAWEKLALLALVAMQGLPSTTEPVTSAIPPATSTAAPLTSTLTMNATATATATTAVSSVVSTQVGTTTAIRSTTPVISSTTVAPPTVAPLATAPPPAWWEVFVNPVTRFSAAANSCIAWYNRESSTSWRTRLPSCQQTMNAMSSLSSIWQIDRSCSARGPLRLDCLMRAIEEGPAPFRCYRSRRTRLTGNSVTRCCYDRRGQVITAGTARSSYERVSNEVSAHQHYLVDIAPYIACCEVARSYCWMFQNRRPTPPIVRPPRVVVRVASGDPHFQPLTGRPFTFNGHGEYVFFTTADAAVNVRLAPSRTVASATFFMGLAIKEKASNKSVEAYVTAQGQINIRVNGELLTQVSGVIAASDSLQIQLFSTNSESITSFEIGSSEASISINGTAIDDGAGNVGALGITLGVVEETVSISAASGLMVPPTSFFSLSSIQAQHSWLQSNYEVSSSAQSLFTYTALDTFADHRNSSYVPSFTIPSSAQSSVQSTCGSWSTDWNATYFNNSALFTCAYDLTVAGLAFALSYQRTEQSASVVAANVVDPPYLLSASNTSTRVVINPGGSVSLAAYIRASSNGGAPALVLRVVSADTITVSMQSSAQGTDSVGVVSASAPSSAPESENFVEIAATDDQGRQSFFMLDIAVRVAGNEYPGITTTVPPTSVAPNTTILLNATNYTITNTTTPPPTTTSPPASSKGKSSSTAIAVAVVVVVVALAVAAGVAVFLFLRARRVDVQPKADPPACDDLCVGPSAPKSEPPAVPQGEALVGSLEAPQVVTVAPGETLQMEDV